MPYLSHSQMETWAQCPRKWALQKIEAAPQAPSEALILGDAVHQALEADGRALMEDGKGIDEYALQSIFQEALMDRLRSDDPTNLIPADAAIQMQRKGYAILRAYVETLQPRYAPLAVEESFTVDIPGTPGWKFTGRIDARVKMPDGTVAILDFKTGKAWPLYAEHSKDQATAYLWSESQQGTEMAGRAVVFVIFPTEPDSNGGYTCRPQFRTTTRNDQQLYIYANGLRLTAEAISEAKRTDDFPVHLSKLCAWCSVRGSCPEGEAHLIQIGYPARVPSVRRVKEASHDARG